MLEEFIARWGYLAVGIGAFVEGETVLVAAGALARKGVLQLPLLLAWAIAGSIAWSQLWFHTGRRAGSFALERWPHWRARAAQLERVMGRHGPLFVVMFRFVAGMGTVCPALLGASGYPVRSYLVLDSIGAAIWSTTFTATGWGLAAGLSKLLGRNTHLPELLTAAVTVGVVLWLGAKLAAWMMRNRTREAE
jgi:membrane protein DedA with SNARE-associated domain